MEIRPMAPDFFFSMRIDRRADVLKLTVAVRNFAKRALKKFGT
jgi:hypothetical protein